MYHYIINKTWYKFGKNLDLQNIFAKESQWELVQMETSEFSILAETFCS